MTNPTDKLAARFGKNLQGILEFSDITQGDFAKRCGLTPAAISQIINGDREPQLSTVIKILDALGVTFERMLK